MQINTTITELSAGVIERAEENIGKCVHCGFCLATCPTYRVLGEEANSPRGRIYSVKQLLEGGEITPNTLDKCLSCRSCETTCPSGVEYHHILTAGKQLIASKRSSVAKLFRRGLVSFLTQPLLFNSGAWLVGKRAHIKRISSPMSAKSANTKQILLHGGCVQQPLLPDINTASYNVLTKLGYVVTQTSQRECCGAIAEHLDNHTTALKQIEANITQWHQALAQGAEMIISNASGCGLMIKDYPSVLTNSHPLYVQAVVVAKHTKDITEFLLDKDLSSLSTQPIRIKYHEPCTLQHGQKLAGRTHQLLRSLGYDCTPIADNHLCCGSAGTYSLFEKDMATRLRDNKLAHLDTPEVIVSSNVGCILHLQKGTHIPVKHWIELLA